MLNWKPGQMIHDIKCPPQPYPPQATSPAQPEPYVVEVFWGGRSKSDSGAKGGAYAIFRDLSDHAASDITIGYAPIHREFPDNPNKKEDWIVTGHVGRLIIPANTAWRVTCLYQVHNDHFENAFVRIRFLSTVRSRETDAPYYPPDAEQA